MKKMLITLMAVVISTAQCMSQQRLLNQPMQLKNCKISVTANTFVATTFIEWEFYNSNAQEIEGLQYFQLNRGQVVTALQLELNGKFRDGSIEERAKANNAYNTIVGKRIDPAILQMTSQDHYSLNIYPVPARSSRKVTMTILQLMEGGPGLVRYRLPMQFFPKLIHSR